MLHDLHDKAAGGGADAAAPGEQLARQEAIRQIERRRRFWFRATAGTVGMLVLAVIWAIAEYNNAGGWPTNGFSQSSGISDVWNYWIIYPAIVWMLATAADAWWVFGHKPISEDQINHEMERQAGQR
jgi:hypothetical protein